MVSPSFLPGLQTQMGKSMSNAEGSPSEVPLASVFGTHHLLILAIPTCIKYVFIYKNMYIL